MDQTCTESDPLQFVPEETAPEEIAVLAASYNGLMQRMATSLKRARQFSADVTHELRTPLTILRGETELALRNDRTQAQLKKVLESNLEEISRMSYLIEDLLLLSKSDLGEIPLKKEAMLVQELILELHHQATLLSANKNITVTLAMPKQELLVNADSLRLRQVFLNLLTNAIKYTPEQGSISIQINEPHNQHVEIMVKDTGIGIPVDQQELIFERFYRIDKTGNRNDGGSGLGLSIARWIIEAHDGTIAVASTPGQGSTFSVTLPLIM
jgi:signal transduction histidine kinase